MSIADTLAQLGIVLPKTPEVQTLVELSNSLDTYQQNLVATQKQMITEMNDRMMTTFADSMNMYTEMSNRIAAQFAAISLDPNLKPSS